MWGIQYTSASASQLIYAAQPILTIIVTNYVFKEKKYPLRSFIGVIVGLIGLGLIIYESAIEHGETISGSLIGNIGITIAMLGWFWYIMLSKKLLRNFSPLEISSTSIMTSFVAALLLLLAQLSFTTIPIHLSSVAILGAVYMGFFGTFLTYILMQYSLKYLSPLTVNLSSYVQPMLVTLLAVIFLGERLTFGFVIGALFVFLGVFLSATVEFYTRRS
jgi:drug/metabolite transporter (DMT)-like permease